MEISLAQIDIKSGAINDNISKMKAYIKKASQENSDLIVFPEMCDTGYDMKVILKKASSLEGMPTSELCLVAKKYNINVIAGISEQEGEDVYNTIIIIDRLGTITDKYRKTHLITAEPMLEHNFLKRGEELKITKIEDQKVGIMTCYEIRFPEISRTLTLQGAEILVIPAAWPLIRLPHWKALLLARAIENQVFVAATSRIGNDTGLQFSGSSTIISPYGETLVSASQIHEKLISSKLDFNFIRTVRSQIKVHQDRRPELYKI